MTTAATVPRKKIRLGKEEQLPPLNNGDHLTRAEFERRYEASPHIKKAELIEGVVYMPSPVRIEHGEPHANIMGWLTVYRANTLGLRVADNATVRLDFENEVQPDAILYRDPAHGGQVKIEDGYLSGAPELVVEVAVSSVAYDLHEKLRVYRRNGVQEYLVLSVYEKRTNWFQLVDSQYENILPDENGVIHSQIFPGLDFHPAMFWSDDLAGLLHVLQQGLSTSEHQAFVAKLGSTAS